MTWQPIETAPKDGTEVFITFWAWDEPGKQRCYAVAGCEGGPWVDMNDDNRAHEFYAPTHWMPLPQPPKEE